MPVIVLAGEEDFQLYRRLDALKAELLDPAWASFNYSRLDNPSAQEVTEQAASLPFGPGNKVVIIDRCDWFAKKRSSSSSSSKDESTSKKTAKSKDSVNEDTLDTALSSVYPNTYIIFVSTSNFDTTLRLSKLVSKYAKLESFPREKIWAGATSPKLQQWCQKEAKHFNATIENEAADYLIEGLEANLRQISSEIEKAAIYILPKTFISLDIIRQLSPHHSSVFSVAEHWLAGDTQKTLLTLRELLSHQNAMQILATMQTMISKWVQIKLLCETYNKESNFGPGIKRRELPPQELAKLLASDIKGGNSFILEKDVRRLSHASVEFLVDSRIELTKLEHLVKTGQMPDSHALELFFLRSPKQLNYKNRR